MEPGLTTKLSESKVVCTTSITVRSDAVRITDTTATTTIATINGQFGGGFSGITILINDSGNPINLVTTGNIQVGATRTIPANFILPLVYLKSTGKWYTGAIS